jgi:hypothetical protein
MLIRRRHAGGRGQGIALLLSKKFVQENRITLPGWGGFKRSRQDPFGDVACCNYCCTSGNNSGRNIPVVYYMYIRAGVKCYPCLKFLK